MTKLLRCVYRSQRDNELTPGASCNTTAAVMVLDASGYPPSRIAELPTGRQPEDWLTEIGDSPAAYEEMEVRCPWFFLGGKPIVRPPEAALMLDWIIERAYREKLTRYTEDLTFDRIMAEIDSGRAMLLRTALAGAGHYVAGVGYEAIQDVGGKVGALISILIMDPWGDWRTQYKNHDGNGIPVPVSDAIKLFKPIGSVIKTGHVVVA